MNDNDHPMSKPPRPGPVADGYSGMRTDAGCRVYRVVKARLAPLHWRLDLWNHSPTGLEWGYCGSGPAQLALAILADATGDDELALDLYQTFKFEVVAGLPSARWAMGRQAILDWVEQHDQRRADLRHGGAPDDDDDDDDDQADDDQADDEPAVEGLNDEDEERVDVADPRGVVQYRNVYRSWAEYLLKKRPGWTVRASVESSNGARALPGLDSGEDGQQA